MPNILRRKFFPYDQCFTVHVIQFLLYLRFHSAQRLRNTGGFLGEDLHFFVNLGHVALGDCKLQADLVMILLLPGINANRHYKYPPVNILVFTACCQTH
ncbi:hypothetical protein D3C74_446570 [compost metagenome]